MRRDRLEAVYLIETPLDPARGRRRHGRRTTSGTFVRVAGETDALRARSRASRRSRRRARAASQRRACRTRWLERQGTAGPWRRARVTHRRFRSPISARTCRRWPRPSPAISTISAKSPACGWSRCACRPLPRALRAAAHGIAGTRALTGVQDRPLIGTIIKPNVGLSAAETAALVAAAVRSRRRLHQGRRGLRQSRPTRRWPSACGRDGGGARASRTAPAST